MQVSGPTSNLRSLAGKLFFSQSSKRGSHLETTDSFKPSVLQQSITQQLIQHHILEQESKNQKIKDQLSGVIQGKQIDAFCIEKETNLHALDSEIRQLKKEKEQLKRLNEKLVGRCEELQQIIN